MGAILAYVVPIIITLGLIIFWRYCTVWNSVLSPKFPTRFHVVLCFLVSLIPAINVLECIGLVIVYIINRVEGELEIKPNNFSKFWFDVEKEKEEDNE